MPCQSDEEEMQRPGSPDPVTPTNPPRNDGAGHDNSDAEKEVTESDEEQEQRSKQKRKRVPNRRGSTARSCALWSCPALGHWRESQANWGGYWARYFRACETIDAPLWTEKTSRSQTSWYQSLFVEEGLRTYITRRNLCYVSMSDAPSLQMFLLSLARDWPRLCRASAQWSAVTLHDASSHENDGSKYLKHDQIVAIHDAAITGLNCPAL